MSEPCRLLAQHYNIDQHTCYQRTFIQRVFIWHRALAKQAHAVCACRTVLDLSARSCVFDLPFFFCRGADRMRVLTNLLSFAFDKVEARPHAVNLQLINNKVVLLRSETGCQGYAVQPILYVCVGSLSYIRVMAC
jgi:hypothetical protein